MLLHLSGPEVIRTAAVAAGQDRQDNASLSFLLSDGSLAHITANWLTPYKVREIQADTSRHLYRCDLIGQKLTAFSRLPGEASNAVREIPVPWREPLRRELEAFVAAVAGIVGVFWTKAPC